MSTYDPVVWEAFTRLREQVMELKEEREAAGTAKGPIAWAALDDLHKQIAELEEELKKQRSISVRLEQRVAELERTRTVPFDLFGYHFPQPRPEPEPEPEYEILAWNTEMLGPLPDNRKLKLSEIQELSVFKRKQ